MPLYMDVHNIEGGVSAVDVGKAHEADLATQSKHGVNYKSYWVDEKAGKIFCLVESPSAEAANTVHREAHRLRAPGAQHHARSLRDQRHHAVRVYPRIEIRYKSSGAKAYFKHEQALRVEATLNNAEDLRLKKTLNAKNWRALRGSRGPGERALLERPR